MALYLELGTRSSRSLGAENNRGGGAVHKRRHTFRRGEPLDSRRREWDETKKGGEVRKIAWERD
jgi:hypothetical protein